MIRSLALASAVLISAVACSRGRDARSDEPRPGTDPRAAGAARIASSGSHVTPSTARQEMIVEKKDLSGPWERAADVVLDASRNWHAQLGAARVVVSALRSPEGETVPYLLLVEQYGADGTPVGRGRALVVDGKLTRGGGAAAAAAYLAAQGFPAQRIDRGLLVELLDIFGVVSPDWLVLPHATGWAAMDEEQNLIQHRPVELEYTGDGATLRLYRAGASQGGDEPSPKERLTVTFDRQANPTSIAERQETDGPWQPLQP